MDGLKKIAAIFALIVVVIAFTGPAMAQYGGRMAQPYQGGGQQAGMQQPGMQQGGMQQGQMGQGQQGGMQESDKDLMATMDNETSAIMFASAVRAAGYDQMLSQQEGPFMVFAPTDKALQKAGVTDIDTLAADNTALKSLVENNIVSKMAQPEQGSDTIAMTSIGGSSINAKKSGGGITVNGFKVVKVMNANNGILVITDGIVGMK